MSSFTIQFVYITNAKPTETAQYEPGDTIGIEERITKAPNIQGTLAFLHVDDAPNLRGIKVIRAEINRPELDIEQNIAKKRAWSLPIFTPEQIQSLDSTRQVVMLWKDLKTNLKRKWDGKEFGSFHASIN